MPFDLYSSSVAAMSARVAPMQEIWGAALWPAAWISRTVSSVRSRVEPPAPYVHEKNRGFSCASCFQVWRSLSIPSGVFGGKNSKLKVRGCFFCDSKNSDRSAHGLLVLDAGAHATGRLDHPCQCGLGFRPAAGLQSAIRIHPQALERDHALGLFEQLQHLPGVRHPRRVDVVYTRTDLVGIAELAEALEQLHVGARGLDGDHVGIERRDRGQDVVEFGVAHVRVDLRPVRDAG